MFEQESGRLAAVVTNDGHGTIDLARDVETASRSPREVRWVIAGRSDLEAGQPTPLVVALVYAADDDQQVPRVRFASRYIESQG